MPHAKESKNGRRCFWMLLAALAILHHDFWLWDNRGLLLGFLPVGLAYHILFSIAAAGLWVIAVKFAWPRDLEAWAEGSRRDKK